MRARAFRLLVIFKFSFHPWYPDSRTRLETHTHPYLHIHAYLHTHVHSCVCLCIYNSFCWEFSALSQSEILNLSLVLGLFRLFFLQKCPLPTPFSVCPPQGAEILLCSSKKFYSFIFYISIYYSFQTHFYLRDESGCGSFVPMGIVNFSGTICWKHFLFPIGLPWQLCW